MTQRGLLSTIATVATGHVVLVLVVWWLLQPLPVSEIPTAPVGKGETRSATPAPVSVQRLAETFASAAFRSMITFDYAALTELVKRAAAWPEVAYLSVEDAQGKVIAHTDAARVGQPWNVAAARESAAARVMHEEVTAPIAGRDASGKPGARVGLVRLGYVADEAGDTAPVVSPPAAASVTGGARWLAVALALAALAGIPVGFALVKLHGAVSSPGDAPVVDLKKIRSLRQARWAIGHWMKETEVAQAQLASQRAELERLRDDVEKRTARMVEVEAQREQLLSEGERWIAERDRLTARLEERERELERARAAVHEQRGRSDDTPRLERALLDAEVADLRDEVVALRSALARHPVVCHDLLDQELKQHQHRVIAYVSHAIRRSLTNVLGFSKLLLRETEGPLNEAQRTNALNIHEAGHHLLQVVNDLTDLTQTEAGAIEARDESVDVTAVLQALAASGGSAIGRDQAALTIAAPPILPPVKGSERSLIRMLLALMRPPSPDDTDGAVEVSAQSDDESITIMVTHRRAPIPAGDLPALFDPFAPIDATGTLQDDGGRVRLALARALAATLGGQIVVDSREETGTVFTVTLPVMADVQAVA